jgi:hypothetical protein
MPVPSSNDELLIEKLLVHLKAEGYSLRTQQWYSARVRQLLEYCNSNALEIEVVRSVHITRFLRQHYRLFHNQHGEVSTPFQNGTIDTPVPSICCFGWCTDAGRFRSHRVLRSRPFTEISRTTTMHGCAICVDCGRRRGPSELRTHCSFWVGSDHVQTRKASPTLRFPISMRT